jgi:hypothetical protein
MFVSSAIMHSGSEMEREELHKANDKIHIKEVSHWVIRLLLLSIRFLFS